MQTSRDVRTAARDCPVIVSCDSPNGRGLGWVGPAMGEVVSGCGIGGSWVVVRLDPLTDRIVGLKENLRENLASMV